MVDNSEKLGPLRNILIIEKKVIILKIIIQLLNKSLKTRMLLKKWDKLDGLRIK